jgi:hypothetical protein
MTSKRLLVPALATLASLAAAQSRTPAVAGTWQVDTPDGPQQLVVRSDSSASFGEETVRWRLAADTMYIAFGDEWVGYNYLLRGDTLTFSGGDLEEPISMVRVGPETPRPAGVAVPRAPASKPRSGG